MYILDKLSDVSGEVVVGVGSFILGYLTYLQTGKERRQEAISNREEKKLRLYERELDNLTEKQESIQQYMERAIDRLEEERSLLYIRISELESKIDILENEALDWQTRYIELFKKYGEGDVL